MWLLTPRLVVEYADDSKAAKGQRPKTLQRAEARLGVTTDYVDLSLHSASANGNVGEFWAGVPLVFLPLSCYSAKGCAREGLERRPAAFHSLFGERRG